jgi:hypothetical protein
MPTERLEGMRKLVDRAAVELANGNELIAGLHHGVEREKLRRMA